MARQPTIWLRKQDGFYYTTLAGKKVRLAQDKKEARLAFHALLARAEPVPAPSARLSFRKAAELYLAFTEQTKSRRTFEHQLYFLTTFLGVVKGRALADLRPADVTAWLLARKATWGHNTQVTARSILRACLTWAVFEGHAPANPLARVKSGATHRRERMLTKDERDAIKAAVPDAPFRNLLTFLELTGCRPFGEAASVTASMIDWAAGTITFEKHKNARKGKTRVVYLVPALQELLKGWCAAKPSGPLFCTRTGRAYNRSNVGTRVRHLERKLGMKRWSLYAFRHAWATEALEKGVPADVLAELGGNSPRTIYKYYSHLDQRKQALGAAAIKAVS